MQIYPWHESQWQQVSSRLQQLTLPHSLLLIGPQGLGKFAFAYELAQRLLCLTPKDNHACGHCRSCDLMQAETHPDYLLIEPEETGKAIKIDKIRRLIDFQQKTSQQGGAQVVLIHGAEAMNRASANALLKSLEEPQGTTYFLLVTSHPHSLPATVRSRCQMLRFSPQSQAIDWLLKEGVDAQRAEHCLRVCEGAPLSALALAQDAEGDLRGDILADMQGLVSQSLDPLSVAEKWKNWPQGALMAWLMSIINDMVTIQVSGKISRHSDHKAALQGLSSCLAPGHWFALNDQLIQQKRLTDSHIALNILLFWEDFLLSMSSAIERP